MPPATYVEQDMNHAQMMELSTKSTTKQFEQIPLPALAFICMAMGVNIKHKFNTKSGKSTYESKNAVVERLMTAIHTRIAGITSGANAGSANATAAATDNNDEEVNFEWINLSDGATLEVPRSTTIADLITIGLTELEGGDDGTGYVDSITIRLTKPGMQDNGNVGGNNDNGGGGGGGDDTNGGGGGNETSDSETDLALGVRGCWVVRVFASFSCCCVSCFLLPLCGVKLARPSG